MSEARHDTATEARLDADAAEGASPHGRHRGPLAPEDTDASGAHGRHRRPATHTHEA
jgi:hypothetical protein